MPGAQSPLSLLSSILFCKFKRVDRVLLIWYVGASPTVPAKSLRNEMERSSVDRAAVFPKGICDLALISALSF